jgi:hypothetical protein
LPAPAWPGRRLERSRALGLLAGLGGDANQAVAALRYTFKAGWGWLDELKEPDFDARRRRGDFKKLLAEVVAKFGPKARPTN